MKSTWKEATFNAQAISDQCILVGVWDAKRNYIGAINVSMDFPTIAGNQTGHAYFVQAPPEESSGILDSHQPGA